MMGPLESGQTQLHEERELLCIRIYIDNIYILGPLESGQTQLHEERELLCIRIYIDNIYIDNIDNDNTYNHNIDNIYFHHT